MNNRNFVNLNINPCKMCMPMGAVMAFKGIENAMMILHGSQGCSTYIRRHMAGHYNEPVDVASSSLNENGTVFGGEKSLKKGLMNIIKQYEPEVIGIATTCLAETIGEDIERIAREFKNESDLGGVKVIPVSSPGYGGTQFEGYYTALCSIVRTLATDAAKNGKINIITSNQSPGDVRNIKAVLDMFGVQYIILPDVSDTLDAPYKKDYKRVPEGGTPIAEIARMAGAAATIEIGMTIDESISPSEILNKKFGVPLYRCPLPVGIESSDRFIKLISEISGKPVPKELEKQRGRYIDTMIDSHKINGEGRAVIFGEPEMVYAMTRLCFENGIKPLIVSTGSKNEKLQKLIEAEAEEMPQILVDTDFETIESLAGKLNSNILIGNSDGKVITEHLGIPLVRVGFPIHDRMGGQRQVNTFYNGSTRLLDEISNTLLESKHSGYRKRMFDSFYKDENKNQEAIPEKKELPIEKKTKEHPCFGEMGCKNARMHIPVAPACNVSCNYCNRKYDCMNESRPGVTSEVLSPKEAAAKFIKVKERYDNLKVVGIAGPGDALANIEKTIESIKLIKEVDPDITFCLSTNGLMLPYYANELVDLGVTHFTVTMNAVDTAILAKVYNQINFMGVRLTGEEGGRILLENQITGIKLLVARGVVCKVNIVMIKGVNDHHIEEVVKKVKELGVFMTNIMPLIPAKGSRFEDFPQTSTHEVNEMRNRCGETVKQMYHCRQCRADAIGTLDKDACHEFSATVKKAQEEKSDSLEDVTMKFAVATKTGIMVDEHFGHAQEFYIYEYGEDSIRLLEKRKVEKYCTGKEDCDEDSKIVKAVNSIADCDYVMVMRIGHEPIKALEEKGIQVVSTFGRIDECIKDTVAKLSKAESRSE